MNILKLHEAIAVVLLGRENRSAHIDEIAYEINKRKLYVRKDETPLPAFQITMRTKLSKGTYHHLFEYLENDFVRLK